MSAPQSTIYVCSGVRLNSRYDHSIFFGSPDDQQEYFAGKVVKTFPAYSYLRKTWPLQVVATMEQARAWSYLYFRNGTGKYYYYFINNVEYKNDNMVELSLELDVLQTYLFDFQLLPSFVERQHTPTDEIGEHTVEEGLDVGELTTNGTNVIHSGKLAIMVMCSINPNVTQENQAVSALPYLYNDVFSGVKIWAVNPDRWQAWGNQLETLNEIGQIEAITAMWMYPMELVELGGESTWNDTDIALPVEKAVGLDDALLDYAIPKQLETIDGYTPKNNKLFCYPYNFAYCTNNEGVHAVYRYERFNGEKMTFAKSGCLAPGGGVHLTPKNYDGLLNNYNAGMNLTGFPTCAWNSDIYKLWLAQNQGQNGLGFLTGALKIAGGVGTALMSAGVTATGVGAVPGVAGIGAGVATAVSGAQQIAGMLAQRHDKEIVPPQANGSFSSSVNITDHQHGFTFYFKSVTAETARIIDDYFTMYGYRLNRVQVPNIHARENYTYVKTVGCNLRGNLCDADLTRVASIFDKGVTFWADGDCIADYSVSNNITGGVTDPEPNPEPDPEPNTGFYLYNGKRLPAMPENIEDYPYRVVCSGIFAIFGLCCSKTPWYGTGEIEPDDSTYEGEKITTGSIPTLHFSLTSVEAGWNDPVEGHAYEFYSGESGAYRVMWSSHDIKGADGSVIVTGTTPVPTE